VSDTPISDSTAHNVVDLGMLCRRLERQLNAATSEIERLTSKVDQLYEGAEEQKQRIKRLEEALREIANQDYRGSRSTESQIAFMALEAKP
jgi:predicted  nucleic acid-binding Zn-ribbon protein